MNRDFFSQNFSEIKEFNIDFNKRLSKKEKSLLLFLIKNERNSEILITPSNAEETEIKEEEILYTLEKLYQKNLVFNVFKDNKRFSGQIKFINYYYTEDNKINVFLSEQFLDLLNNYTILNKFDIISILRFTNKHSESLFKYIQKVFSESGKIEISLDNLKELLNIHEVYERFYDFNTKVLKACCDDISKISHISVNYKLIKSGNFSNNKVLAIEFEIINEKHRSLDEEIDAVFKIIKEKIINFSNVRNRIEYYLLKYDFNYVSANLFFSLNNYNGIFDDFLLNSLEGNFAEFTKNSPILTIKKIIKNSYSLHSEIVSIFKSLNNYGIVDHTINNISFLQKIYSLKEGDTIELRIGDYLLDLKYNKKISDSIIKLFKLNK